MKKLQNKVKKVKNQITFKLIRVFIVFVLPLNILAIALTLKATAESKEQIRLSILNITNVYMNVLDSRMEQADYFLFDMYNNNADCIRMCLQKEDAAYVNAKFRCYKKLNEKIDIKNESDGYFFYMGDAQDLLLQVNYSNLSHKAAIEDYLLSEENRNSIRRWSIVELDGKKWALRCTHIKNVWYGAFICLDTIAGEMEEIINYSNPEIIFSEKGFAGDLSTMQYTADKGDKGVYTATKSERTSICLYISISNAEVINQLTLWQKAQIGLAFLYLGLIPLLYLFLKRFMIGPLSIMNEAHSQLEIGNEEYRIKRDANSYEFGRAYDSFNKMADNIHSLKIDNMQKELNSKKLELSNLQLQVRPHFLLNTFNLIFNLALNEEIAGIKELVLYLSDYFRYIFRSGKDLELFDKELRLIENYIKAEEIRYPGEFSVAWLIDPDVRLVRVPPLLVHNFIENIFKHALHKGRFTHIMISAEYAQQMVTIQISDDGAGMSEEYVRQINEECFYVNEKEIHIGIRNSIDRMKSIYGEEASVKVESELGNGTIFTITFPFNLEETV